MKEVKTNGATTATFVYDAFGRRQQKVLTSGATTVNTLFTYDGHNPIQERSGALGTKPVTANIRTGLGIDEFISRSEITPTAANRHFLTNHLGSVLALTDAAGAITKTYRYEPYGKQTTTGEASTNAFQYTGREADEVNGVSTTGLYYYRARYYDPMMQRFVGEDPIGLTAGDANFYRYVFNNPLSFSDPTGMDCYYSQSSGNLSCDSGLSCSGFSGRGHGRNNPDRQHVRNEGPIPGGGWKIGLPRPGRPGIGWGGSLPLSPLPGTTTGGRDGFNIHGPDPENKGCITVPPDCLSQIPPGETLRVSR